MSNLARSPLIALGLPSWMAVTLLTLSKGRPVVRATTVRIRPRRPLPPPPPNRLPRRFSA